MTSQRPRTPGVTYAVLTLLLVVLLAALALTARQPPPPTIAEFAPQAVEQITDVDQTGASSVGAGAGAAQSTASSEGALTPSIDVPRARRCVGEPPRQIEDPQSPPCVPYWSGDNTGATTRGVTRDEIRIALATTEDALTRVDYALVNFFNKRFEFYGRRLSPVHFKPVGDNQTPEVMLADAQKVSNMNVFANLSYAEQQGRESVFYDELARLGVLSVQGAYTGIPNSDEAHFRRFAPYEWNYLPSVDVIGRSYGELICNSLAGRPPAYAGAPQATASKRVFGVFNASFADGTPSADITPLRDAAGACGVALKEVRYDGPGAGADNAVLQMTQAGVTSVICMCHTSHIHVFLMPTASAQGWHPEWMISNYIHADDDFAAGLYNKDQSVHLFGLMSHGKSLNLQDLPWYWAIKETDPSYSVEEHRNEHINVFQNFMYVNLLVLSSGIQMAGPSLTPRSFESALRRTKFPNPGAAAAPYWQGTVGFAASHTMVQDLAMVWWSPTAASKQVPGQTGAYCFVDHGARYAAGSWPKQAPRFFTGDCD